MAPQPNAHLNPEVGSQKSDCEESIDMRSQEASLRKTSRLATEQPNPCSNQHFHPKPVADEHYE